MNIGFDASRAFIDKKTGTENYSYQLLSHLLQMDHTNSYYIYTRFLKGRPCSTARPPLTQYKSIPFPRLWTQAGLALQTFKDPLDVLFVPAHTLPLIRKPGLKTVVTVHDLGAEYLPQTHQIKQRLYLNLMTHHQLKSATHIIAVSETTKQDLIKKVGIDPKKITVVYEGFNQELFSSKGRWASGPKINQTLKHYNLQHQTYYLFVGTIQPRKNLERLIKAYALFLKRGVTGSGVPPRAPAAKLLRARTSDGAADRQAPERIHPKLILAGNKGWLADEIYELPKKLGIEEHVKFLGYVPDEDLPALYSSAISFLFPSLFEGFGIPLLEAMACGCPVLTSNLGSMKEIVTDKSAKSVNLYIGESDFDMPDIPIHRYADTLIRQSSALLIDPYSVEDIAQGITRIQNKELRIKLIKAGLEQVKKFSWEKAARETLKVLEETNLL